MLRVKQLGLLFLVAVLWASLRGIAGAQQTLTSSFFEAECVINHSTQLRSCPGDPTEFLPGTKCYSCSIGDGNRGIAWRIAMGRMEAAAIAKRRKSARRGRWSVAEDANCTAAEIP
jgi:hypothetical protein